MADSERHVVVPQLTNLPHIWDSTCLLRNHVHNVACPPLPGKLWTSFSRLPIFLFGAL